MPQTTRTERVMTSAPFRVTVTASEEQIPSTRTVMGFPLKMGFRRVSFNLASMAYSSSQLGVSQASGLSQQGVSAGAALRRKYWA